MSHLRLLPARSLSFLSSLSSFLVLLAASLLAIPCPADGAAARRAEGSGPATGSSTDDLLCDLSPGSVVRRGARDRLEVALTFDDGPSPTYTPKVLEVLERLGLEAAFFVAGKHAERRPEMIRRIAREGHIIGNHSMHHFKKRLSYEKALAEITLAERAIVEAGVPRPRYFRSPHGLVGRGVREAARELGYLVVEWSFLLHDWLSPKPEEILARVLARVHPGAILVLHDGGRNRDSTVASIPLIVGALRERGYRFVRLDELLRRCSRRH